MLKQVQVGVEGGEGDKAAVAAAAEEGKGGHI